MRSIAKLISKLPLAGKMATKPLVFGLYHSISKKDRTVYYSALVVLLSLSVILHLEQAAIGIEALQFDSPLWAKFISAVYTDINLSVVLAQGYLLYRATCFCVQGTYLRQSRHYKQYSGLEVAKMVGVTLGGQFIFLAQWAYYR